MHRQLTLTLDFAAMDHIIFHLPFQIFQLSFGVGSTGFAAGEYGLQMTNEKLMKNEKWKMIYGKCLWFFERGPTY